MRTLKLLSLLGWAWLSGCAHGPSSSNLATALPTASFVGVGVAPFPDIIGLELPASYDEDSVGLSNPLRRARWNVPRWR